MLHTKKCVYCRERDAASWTGFILHTDGKTHILAGWCTRCTRHRERIAFKGHYVAALGTMNGHEWNRWAKAATAKKRKRTTQARAEKEKRGT